VNKQGVIQAMSRFPQKEATKGSQKWIQKLINNKPDHLNSLIKEKLKLDEDEQITWYSPLKTDDYAEYRDNAFLKLLGIKLEAYPLKNYWPKNGPQWDALGKSYSEKIFLVEAKSHIPELISTLKAINKDSRNKILESLEETRKSFGVNNDFDWSKTFYQYANRLAHLHLLRKNKISAFMINVNFFNDSEVGGPMSAAEWRGAIRLLHRCLGLKEQLLKNKVIEVYIDITDLKEGNLY